jgi:hypothetical protein
MRHGREICRVATGIPRPNRPHDSQVTAKCRKVTLMEEKGMKQSKNKEGNYTK